MTISFSYAKWKRVGCHLQPQLVKSNSDHVRIFGCAWQASGQALP